MRRFSYAAGIALVVLGVAVAVLSLLTYADGDERELAESRLSIARGTQDVDMARSALERVQERERTNIVVAISGTVAAMGGSAIIAVARKRRKGEPLSR